ncbi:MAG TPA: ATPase, T2SS/T4P/T4SS family [Candidatus Deferrimicrobiaceae bacterium]|jgi:type II secretory ATPase GspE/PulE/Tfp pilus assembly ATPase PilB-like protein
MTTNLVVTLRNGQSIQGTLAQPFDGTEIEIDVVDRNRKKTLLPMSEVAHILFEGLPAWADGRKPNGVEEVQTTAGDNFRVEVYEKGRHAKGFFGTLVGEPPSNGFKMIFFVKTAVRFRHQEKSLGDILLEKGLLSADKIDQALDAQKALRDRRIGDLISESAKVPKETIEKTLRTARKTDRRNVRVGEVLIAAGLVTREQIEKAFDKQVSGKRVRVGELLVRQGLVTEEQLLNALAAKFQMRFVDLTGRVPTDEALAALSEGLVDRLHVLPLEIEEDRLVVATSAPADHTIGDALRLRTKHEIELVVAPAAKIAEAIERHYRKKPDPPPAPLEFAGVAQEPMVEEEVEDDRESLYVEPDSEVISLVNKILIDATNRGASDIHFEPGGPRQPVVIRYRIDGECLVAHRIAPAYRYAVISRLKILAALDIAERRKPQSGKFMLRLEKQRVEYRVEITPTIGKLEDAVLRVLSATKLMPLEAMELLPSTLARIHEIAAKPYGVILCVGPTGSGKTTTLHSILGSINQPERKIWTAEDPVEITQPGLRQVQVNARIGFTFAEAMRSFLRGDPDVVMIGEMRDAETARITIEASLTGHLVLSTLHTNNAPETAVRLIEMGMDPFNFADALLGIIAQRLCRRLCVDCREKVALPRQSYDRMRDEFLLEAPAECKFPSFESVAVMGPVGCQHCNGTGYRGRIALHELLVGTPAVKDAIRKKADVAVLKRLALDEGMLTLKMDGMLKVLRGLTDMKQVLKVCM